MKLKKGFKLCPTLGYTMVIATGDLADEFDGIIKLNETSADIWRWIDEGLSRDEIIERYQKTYTVDKVTANRDFDLIYDNMRNAKVFEQE